MTWDPQRQAFVCTRGRKTCTGTGQAVVVKPATPHTAERCECPVCGRVGLPVYDTDDGRTIVMAH